MKNVVVDNQNKYISTTPDNKTDISNEKMQSHLPSSLSSPLTLESPEDIYHDRLHRALSDTGNFSYGISAIEAWVINEKKTCLVRPMGAWWLDPNYQPPPHLDKDKCRRAIKKLEDPKDKDYLEPEAVQPGLGLPGLMWAECYCQKNSTVRNNHNKAISEFGSFHGVTQAPSLTTSYRRLMFSLRRFSISLSSSRSGKFGDEDPANALTWRDLNFISHDPDHMLDKRIDGFIESGMGQVAGIPFDTPSSRGIILLYVRSDTDILLLNQKRNVDYLKRSAYLIGSVLDLADLLVSSWEAKQEEYTVAKLATMDNSKKSKSCISFTSKKKRRNNNKGIIAVEENDEDRNDNGIESPQNKSVTFDIEEAISDFGIDENSEKKETVKDDAEETKSSIRSICVNDQSGHSVKNILEIDSTNSNTHDAAVGDDDCSGNDGIIKNNHHYQKSVTSTNNKQTNRRSRLVQKFIMVKDKTFDADKITIKAPPPMPSSECIWTFVGSFVTILSLSFVSNIMNSIWMAAHHHHNENGEIYRFSFPLGPLGALSTLVYGLTSAPASQPRNAIYGSIISGCAGLIASYIPFSLINLRLALALSLSNSCMARFGVTHPPGGALSLILSMDNNYDWLSLLLYLICVLIAIMVGTLINNLNEKRTYPQYWNMFTY